MFTNNLVAHAAKPYLENIKEMVRFHQTLYEQANRQEIDPDGPDVLEISERRYYRSMDVQRWAIHYAEQQQAETIAYLTKARNSMAEHDSELILEAAQSIANGLPVEGEVLNFWRTTLVAMRFYPLRRAQQAAQTLRTTFLQMEESADEIQSLVNHSHRATQLVA